MRERRKGEGGKLTTEVNERPCGCDFRISQILSAIQQKMHH